MLNASICSAEIMPSALVKEKCVSALESNRTMPSPSGLSGGTTMGKILAHRSGNSVETRGIREPLDLFAVRLNDFSECLAEAAPGAVHDPHTRSLDRIHCGHGAQLAQPSIRTHGQIHAGRVGAIDDVEIVVAGQHQNELGELGMLCEIV